jgi:hypothetical protein
MYTAILSTTVLPLDGTYTVLTVEAPDNLELEGIPHYVGHPSTKQLLESLGAVQAPSKLFTGLQPGESALTCAIKQGQSVRTTGTIDQDVTIDQLSFRVVTRID